jgi:hypothetical protein
MHASSHLREDFLSYLDSLEPGGNPATAEEQSVPLDSLLKELHGCTDILPAGYCDQLDLPKGSRYAAAVKEIKASRLHA